MSDAKERTHFQTDNGRLISGYPPHVIAQDCQEDAIESINALARDNGRLILALREAHLDLLSKFGNHHSPEMRYIIARLEIAIGDERKKELFREQHGQYV